MRSRVYGWGDQRPRQTTWRESCIPLSNLLLCSSGVWHFVFSDSRKKGEKKVSISYSLVGIHNVKVVKVVPYFYPSLWLLSFFGPMPSPLICFSWEFPFYRCKTNKTKTKTVPWFYFFTRKLNELTEFLGSSIDASIGAAFVSFESYWGKKISIIVNFNFLTLLHLYSIL